MFRVHGSVCLLDARTLYQSPDHADLGFTGEARDGLCLKIQNKGHEAELKRCMLVVALKNLREVDAESALMIPCGEMSAVLHLPNVLRLQAQKRWWSRRSPLWKVPGAL
jgi:hypothetical protein